MFCPSLQSWGLIGLQLLFLFSHLCSCFDPMETSSFLTEEPFCSSVSPLLASLSYQWSQKPISVVQITLARSPLFPGTTIQQPNSKLGSVLSPASPGRLSVDREAKRGCERSLQVSPPESHVCGHISFHFIQRSNQYICTPSFNLSSSSHRRWCSFLPPPNKTLLTPLVIISLSGIFKVFLSSSSFGLNL